MIFFRRLPPAPPGASGSPSPTVAAPPCRHLRKESLSLLVKSGDISKHWFILLMDKILHQWGCLEICYHSCDIHHMNWCEIMSIKAIQQYITSSLNSAHPLCSGITQAERMTTWTTKVIGASKQRQDLKQVEGAGMRHQGRPPIANWYKLTCQDRIQWIPIAHTLLGVKMFLLFPSTPLDFIQATGAGSAFILIYTAKLLGRTLGSTLAALHGAIACQYLEL